MFCILSPLSNAAGLYMCVSTLYVYAHTQTRSEGKVSNTVPEAQMQHRQEKANKHGSKVKF